MKLLILNGGMHESALISEAKREGMYVVAGGLYKPPAEYCVADEYIAADYNDLAAMREIAVSCKVDAICTPCTDNGAINAAVIAQELGLPGHDSPEVQKILSRKDDFKKLAKRLGITSPIAEEFHSAEEAKAWICAQTLPIIVKPADSSAGSGISTVTYYAEAEASVQKAFEASRSKVIVAEPFITGTQHGMCAFLINKKIAACVTNDELSGENKYLVKTDIFPATGFEEVKEQLYREVELIAAELDLVDGIFHLQYIQSGGKAYILEVMKRNIGNMYCIPASRAFDFNWNEWYLRSQCGLDCSGLTKPSEHPHFSGYTLIQGTKNGVVKDVYIAPELQKKVHYQVGRWYDGYEIKDFQADKIGILFFDCDSREEANDVAARADELVQVIYR